MHSSRVVACLFCLSVVFGCGGGSEGDSSGDTGNVSSSKAGSTGDEAGTERMSDACGLITKSEADQILRTSVTTRSQTKSHYTQCDYEGAGGSGFALKVFWDGGKEELAVTKSAMQIAPAVMEDNGMDAAGMLTLQQIDGLGDEAYFNPIAGSYVREGDVLLEFDLRLMLFQAPTQEAAVAQWRALAEKALGRI